MNWLDYGILGVLAVSVLVGLWRGFASEMLALVIWIAAFWAAWALGPAVAEHLEGAIELPSARIIAAYLLCFIAVLVLGALLRFIVHKLVEGTGLSGTDRLLGMVFGLVRGVLLVTLVVFLAGFTAFTRDPWWQESATVPTFQRAAAWLGQHVPAEVRGYLQPAAALERLDALPIPSGTAADRAAAPVPAGSAGTPPGDS